MTPGEFLKHSINYEQLRTDMGLLISLLADEHISDRTKEGLDRVFKVLCDLQQITVNNGLLNGDIVYGKIPDIDAAKSKSQ